MGYIRIKIFSLVPDKETYFNLYLYINSHYILYLHAGNRLSALKISNFEQQAVFYILESDKQAYKGYIKEHLYGNELDPKSKAKILRESSFTLVEELFEKQNIGQSLEESKDLIQDLIKFMDSDSNEMNHLIGLSTHDFYTYNHSLDVSIYSLGIGSVVGYSGKELEELGQGALFHDIGKRFVPIDIICKKGPLNEEELAHMRCHPQYGVQIFEQFPNIAENVKTICFEHHENYLTGDGYPQKIRGENIHPFARIVAIMDTYDAMTTNRSYCYAKPPTEVFQIMKDKLAYRYDPELLKIMQSAFAQIDKQI